MKTIYKYKLKGLTLNEIMMPRGADILSGGLDPNGDVCVWARVDTTLVAEPVTIYMIATGDDVPAGLTFIATILLGPFVWHLFR